MIDQWFLEEIEKHLSHRARVVLLDPEGQCEFLLPLLSKKGYNVLFTKPWLQENWQTVQEELFLRHRAESEYANEKVVFYVTRPQQKLSFLFDYCFTHGCLDLSKPGEWLRNKLFTHTNLQVNMDNPLLLTAAKLGIGKDLNWWKKILQNLEQLVSIEEELLPFMASPEAYLGNKDKDVRRLFEEKLFDLLEQNHRSKPPQTLANEVATLLFEKLLNNDLQGELLSIYYKWVDSNTYADSLKEYLLDHKMDTNQNIWNVHQDHCFERVDKRALREICANLRDSAFVKEKLQRLRPRVQSQRVAKWIPTWWQDIYTLLEYDSKPLASTNSFEQVVAFYTTHFHQIDRAIRNLYSFFLQEEAIIRPLQEYYESQNHALLQHWFDATAGYRSNQQGHLVQLLQNAKPNIAVIVGDGVRYEIADYVATILEKQYIVTRNTMLADMPSETEHNMSALYVGNQEVLAVHKDREKRLVETTKKDITYLNLEALHYGIKAEYLVLTYKDIDSAGEKLQQGAIKLFSEFEKVLIEKIDLLLKMGYREVHLVTDHGFVLTGLLDEADKIDPNATGKKEVHERFIRTADKQYNNDWVVFEKKYKEYQYVYAAKNHRPFKSKGVYGFSHGGFTPQEIIVPNFVFIPKCIRFYPLVKS